MATPLPKTLGPDNAENHGLSGVALAVLLAAAAAVLSLAVHAIRTTPGLVTIAAGAAAAVLGHPWAGLAAAVVGGLIYREQCGRTPYADCIRCHGTGHRPARRTRLLGGRRRVGGRLVARRCRFCGGKGVRMRWGRTLMNTYRRATYTPRTTPDAAPVARQAPAAGPVTYADALRRHHDRDPRGPRAPVERETER